MNPDNNGAASSGKAESFPEGTVCRAAAALLPRVRGASWRVLLLRYDAIRLAATTYATLNSERRIMVRRLMSSFDVSHYCFMW